MTERRCDGCGILFPEEELLISEQKNKAICQQCSGLIDGEDLSCRYDEG